MKKERNLRMYLKKKQLIVAPGAFDALTAKIVERTGFPAVYLTGYGASANLLGAPDIGILTLTEMVRHAKYMVESVNIPVIADADTGYGDSINITRTVEEYEKAGVSAIQLEDQVLSKRCGHMEGKEVVSCEEMVQRIKVAVKARKDKDLVIIARTDARAVYTLEEAIRRGNAYAKAGADVIFIEAMRSMEEIKKVTKSIKTPLLINLIEKGKTPLINIEQVRKFGFGIVIYPLSSLYASAKAVSDLMEELKTKGTTEGMMKKMITFKKFNELVGLSRYRKDAV